MMRGSLLVAALVAVLGAGCSGGEGGATTPTAPTTTTPSTPTTGGSTPTQSGKPAAPSGLRVTVNDSTRVFTWNSVSNVQDYFIQIGPATSVDASATASAAVSPQRNPMGLR